MAGSPQKKDGASRTLPSGFRHIHIRTSGDVLAFAPRGRRLV